MRNKEFFKGWYFKHQNGKETLAFIPGINILENGESYSFIQVISDEGSYNFKFDFNKCVMEKGKIPLSIQENSFSLQGIKINLKDGENFIKGEIRYEDITPIKYNIMGPFSLIPFMECNHGVLSLHHKLYGKIILNNKVYDFDGGIGYIEMDYGVSFPKDYLWLQCNDFKEKASVMVSIAEIPFKGLRFKGCICSIFYKGIEYRLATYKGVKIIKYNEKYVELKQGKYRLVCEIKGHKGHELKAPVKGEMNRIIKESPSCFCSFKFYINNKKIFKLKSPNGSFEFVE